jgi:hypothetical protein
MEEKQEDLDKFAFTAENLPSDEELHTILGIVDYKQAEWVFQFDDEEPVVFAWSGTTEEPGDLTFTIKPNSDSNVVFSNQDGTKILRLFAREMSDITKDKR